ncbi:hypothetical protein Y032_0014g2462 [Ancylostoma ceylanicum]|uniref:Uncharacterized protein n=1 Tax=Ancylostoma ceylanicum TaxID=53326 RepID=A0A016VAQ4_9BILA|nr:hypothetical protein Y032_0014g2462 [Ancylostoma ceylanicum]
MYLHVVCDVIRIPSGEQYFLIHFRFSRQKTRLCWTDFLLQLKEQDQHVITGVASTWILKPGKARRTVRYLFFTVSQFH